MILTVRLSRFFQEVSWGSSTAAIIQQYLQDDVDHVSFEKYLEAGTLLSYSNICRMMWTVCPSRSILRQEHYHTAISAGWCGQCVLREVSWGKNTIIQQYLQDDVDSVSFEKYLEARTLSYSNICRMMWTVCPSRSILRQEHYHTAISAGWCGQCVLREVSWGRNSAIIQQYLQDDVDSVSFEKYLEARTLSYSNICRMMWTVCPSRSILRQEHYHTAISAGWCGQCVLREVSWGKNTIIQQYLQDDVDSVSFEKYLEARTLSYSNICRMMWTVCPSRSILRQEHYHTAISAGWCGQCVLREVSWGKNTIIQQYLQDDVDSVSFEKYLEARTLSYSNICRMMWTVCPSRSILRQEHYHTAISAGWCGQIIFLEVSGGSCTAVVLGYLQGGRVQCVCPLVSWAGSTVVCLAEHMDMSWLIQCASLQLFMLLWSGCKSFFCKLLICLHEINAKYICIFWTTLAAKQEKV